MASVDEAIHELLSISTDISAVAVLGPGDEVLGAGPDPVSGCLPEAVRGLWDAAAARASGGDAPLHSVIVQDAEGGVAVIAAGGRLIAALTRPQPAVGLLLFDLRTCLSDACPEEELS
jgi:hypothetical protein